MFFLKTPFVKGKKGGKKLHLKRLLGRPLFPGYTKAAIGSKIITVQRT